MLNENWAAGLVKFILAFLVSLVLHAGLACLPHLLGGKRPLTASEPIQFIVIQEAHSFPTIVASSKEDRTTLLTAPVNRLSSTFKPKSSSPSRKVAQLPKPKHEPPSPSNTKRLSPPVSPAFGIHPTWVNESSSSVRVPVGNTMAADLSQSPNSIGHKLKVAATPLSAIGPSPSTALAVPLSLPRIRQEFKIDYPEEARSMGIEGTVKVQILVDKQGRVKETKVLSGPGFGLNEAARQALLRFVFIPAMGVDGKPQSYRFVYEYVFQIDNI